MVLSSGGSYLQPHNSIITILIGSTSLRVTHYYVIEYLNLLKAFKYWLNMSSVLMVVRKFWRNDNWTALNSCMKTFTKWNRMVFSDERMSVSLTQTFFERQVCFLRLTYDLARIDLCIIVAFGIRSDVGVFYTVGVDSTSSRPTWVLAN